MNEKIFYALDALDDTQLEPVKLWLLDFQNGVTAISWGSTHAAARDRLGISDRPYKYHNLSELGASAYGDLPDVQGDDLPDADPEPVEPAVGDEGDYVPLSYCSCARCDAARRRKND